MHTLNLVVETTDYVSTSYFHVHTLSVSAPSFSVRSKYFFDTVSLRKPSSAKVLLAQAMIRRLIQIDSWLSIQPHIDLDYFLKPIIYPFLMCVELVKLPESKIRKITIRQAHTIRMRCVRSINYRSGKCNIK